MPDETTGDYSTVYVNTASNGTNMQLSTSITLFTGLELPNQYALAKLNLKAATADLEKAKEDISINIASAYLQVLFNQELHEVGLADVDVVFDGMVDASAQRPRLLCLKTYGEAGQCGYGG